MPDFSYQKGPVAKGKEFFTRKSKAANQFGLIVAPGGSGKSHMIKDISIDHERPLVVIQPNQELVKQNFEKYFMAGGRDAAIFSASLGQKQIGKVTFATIGSICNPDVAPLFDQCDAIIDEADSYPMQDSYSMIQRFVDLARVRRGIGFTATPVKMIKGELKFLTRMKDKFYGHVIDVIQVADVINSGAWCELKYADLGSNYDNSVLKLNSTGADYTDASKLAHFKKNNIVDQIIQIYHKAKAHGRKSFLVFLPSVKECEILAKALPDCVALSEKTEDRDLIVRRFKQQRISMVANVRILDTGFDFPKLDCIIDASPTNSWNRYMQRYLRGVRHDPTKKDCWIYCLNNNFQKFGRLESIHIAQHPEFGWGVFTGTNKRLISNIPLDLETPFTWANCGSIARAKANMYRAYTS